METVFECELPTNINGLYGLVYGYVLKNCSYYRKIEEKGLLWRLEPKPVVSDELGVRFFEIQAKLYNSAPESHENENEIAKMTIIKIRAWEKNSDKTSIAVELCLFEKEIFTLVDEFKDEIAFLWPETKRQLFYPFDGIDLEDILFDYEIEVDPSKFIHSCHEELHRLHPGVFTFTFDKGEILTITSGMIFPPDNHHPFWEYAIFGADTEFSIGENGEVNRHDGFYGMIIKIELQPTINNCYRVVCVSGTRHYQILEWLKRFENHIIQNYHPTRKNNSFSLPDLAEKGLAKIEIFRDLEQDEYLSRDKSSESNVAQSEEKLVVQPHPTLEKNKQDVKKLSVEGLKIREISYRLGISVSTVKRYRNELGITKHRRK